MKNQTTGHAKDKKKLGSLMNIPDKRDALLITFGLHVGMRATSELCRLKWGDVVGRDHIDLYQPKTGKTRRFLVPDALKAKISECYEGQPLNSYIFTGRRGQKGDKPLTNCGVNKILRKLYREHGIEFYGNDSSHAMRKTFVNTFINANGGSLEALELARDEVGHSSIKTTLIYAGISFENKGKLLNNISYA